MNDVEALMRKALKTTKQKSLKSFNPLNFIYMKIILSMAPGPATGWIANPFEQLE